LHKFTQYMRN